MSSPIRRLARWAGYGTRSAERDYNNLGIVSYGTQGGVVNFRVRDERLAKLDLYYENKQYDDLMDWNLASASADYVPIRQRKPRVRYNYAKRIANQFAAKMLGHAVFPQMKMEDDTEDNETNFALKEVLSLLNLQASMPEAMRRLAISGSVCLTHSIVDGDSVIEVYNSNHCYPVLNAKGELEEVTIRYTYQDHEELDAYGKPKEKWFQKTLTEYVDTLYDNPEVTRDMPEFVVVDESFHELGFVQAEWFKLSDDPRKIDGESLIQDCLDFIDEINYSLSQSGQAIAYSQEPQLGISGLDEDGIDTLIRSSTKTWNLGRQGSAQYIESNLSGVSVAQENRDKLRLAIQDVSRVTMHDPEKMVASAQSGKALEILHGPMVDLINEARPLVEVSLRDFVLKCFATYAIMHQRGEETSFIAPPGWQPATMNLRLTWPSVFDETLEDLDKKVRITTSLSNASIISRETALRHLAKYFGIENIEEETEKIKAQPVINPFSAF